MEQHRGQEIEPGDIGPGGKKRPGTGTMSTAKIENARARPSPDALIIGAIEVFVTPANDPT